MSRVENESDDDVSEIGSDPKRNVVRMKKAALMDDKEIGGAYR